MRLKERLGTSYVALGVGAVVAVAIAIVVSAAEAADTAEHSPIVPPGHWHAALRVSLVVAFGAYLLGVLLLRRTRVDARLVLFVAAVVQLLPLLGPVLLSTDVRSYSNYGHLAAFEGRDPYVQTSDNQVPTVYGPLFTLLSEAIAHATGGGDTGVARFVYRLIAVAAVLGSAWLASRLAHDAAVAVALIGWNPLVALHFGGGGHNDSLFVLLILAGLLVERHGRERQAAALWSVSMLTKWVSLAFAPMHLAALVRRGERRRAASFLGAFVATTVLLAALASLRYGSSWFDAVGTVSHIGTRTGSIGPGHWISTIGLSPSARDYIITAAQVLVIGGLTVWAWFTGHARLGLAGTLLAATQGWLNPWYAMWGLGLAAADERDRLGRALAVLLSAYLMLDVTTW